MLPTSDGSFLLGAYFLPYISKLNKYGNCWLIRKEVGTATSCRKLTTLDYDFSNIDIVWNKLYDPSNFYVAWTDSCRFVNSIFKSAFYNDV